MPSTLAFFLCVLTTLSSAQDPFWQRIGPHGGTATNLIILSNGDILAGGTGAYHYRSTDDGESWTKYGPHPHVLSSDGTLYGTGYRDVYRSTDNGYSWTDLTQDQLLLYGTNALATDRSGRIIIVGGNRHPQATSAIAFRSVDSGRTWQDVLDGNSVHTIFRTKADNFLLSCDSPGLFRSVNDGGTWHVLPNALLSLRVLCFSEWNDSTLLCGTESQGIFESTDDGISWKQKSDSGLTSRTVNAILCENSLNLWIGTNAGVFHSSDGGNRWEKMSDGLLYPSVRCLTRIGTDTLFAGTTEGGVYRSVDNGRSWSQKSSGWSQLFITTVGRNFESVFAGTSYGGGLLRSVDQGNSWQIVSTLIQYVNVIYSHDGIVYVGTGSGGLYRSIDDGRTWSSLSNGFSNRDVTSLAVHERYIFVGTENGGIYRSTDEGLTWEQSALGDLTVYGVLITQDTLVVAGSDGGRFYKSTDLGFTWKRTGPANSNGHSFVVNRRNEILSAGQGGIAKSTDDGDTWIPLSSGLTSRDFSKLEINQQGALFASSADDHGVFMSTNDGDDWQQMSKVGLPVLSFHDMIVDSLGYVFLAARFDGVLRTMNTTLTNISGIHLDTPFEYSLSPGYPNPFNARTTISFSHPLAQHVRLTIHDVLGREIETLLNERREAGHFEIAWNASRHPSGIYLCSMAAGQYHKTIKLLLIK